MILSCPACQTRYAVPASAIGPNGRQVRCAHCKHSWHQDPPPEAELVLSEPPSAFAAAPPEPAPMPQGPRAVHAPEPEAEPERADAFAHEPPFRPRRNRAGLWTALALAAAVLMLTASLAIYYFGVPGLAAEARGGGAESPLEIEGSAQRRRLESGNELLAVTGQIRNPTADIQPVPQIQAELTDGQGRVVYSWSIAAPVASLQPGQLATFDSAEVDVPRGARHLTLRLGAPAEEGEQQVEVTG